MILGIGTDITDIRRIEKLLEAFGAKFEQKFFTAGERAKAKSRTKAGKKTVAATYAKRYAAKEACAKALGTGLGKDASWREIEVKNLGRGNPTLALTGNALKRLKSLTPRSKKPRISLSLADEYPFALAWVIIEAV